MLKFNLTQEGKSLIDALQGDAKLAITKVLLRGSAFNNKTSKEITSFKGAVCNDGTGNGAYVVIDITDNSNSNYSCNVIELFSDQTKIATQCVDEQSGYEVTLYCGERGKNTYPSITYRTQTWTSRKTPTNIQLSRSMAGEGKQCGININGGGVEAGSATFDFENGNFPKTITFANGDVWVTNETVSAAGVTEQADYYASSEMGDTSIRPLFSKVLIQKESNKQLKLRVSCQFDGAEKCKFNTTSINLPYASRFREGVVRFTDTSSPLISDGQKYNTVYSAADVDAKIDAVTESLGNLKDYAKINAENTFAENNTFTKNVIVNGEISGAAVTDAGTDGDKHIVNVGYADGKYLSKDTASSTYLSKNEAGTTYLTKNEASSTYLTQSVASTTYLTKDEATTAAVNYAKLDGGNTFTGAKNTFQEVSVTKLSGDGVVDAITTNATQSNQSIPTDYAVKTYVDGKTGTLTNNITALQNKDTELQSQIDGINAGQNLADIVNDTDALAEYDISHLKAKDDLQHGEGSKTWAIGDKVQVLGGADAQSCVYELIKGTKQDTDINSIVSSTAGYYWHYIGVYGTNAYTKAEIDDKLNGKVDKTQITTTISGDTATNENIPSASAVKTYVDTVANDLPNKYVTLDTVQEITGAKTFANGNITIANPNSIADNKAKHYVTIGAAGNNTTKDYTSSILHYDLTHNDFASDQFVRARPNDDPKKSSNNVSYTRSLSRGGTNGYTFGSKLEQHIGTHYKYTASDMYMTTGDPNLVSPLPGAQIGTPGNTAITDPTLTENYVERIRLRKNTSVAGDADIEFLPAGQSVTDIDLFADNINNVFNNEVSFRVCTTSGEGAKTDTSVLEIRSSGIYYHTPEGNSISTAEYQLRTAGSLDFTTSMSGLVESDAHVPTTKAVADFVVTKITGITGGTAFVKTSAPGTNQTIASSVTVNEGLTVGTNEIPANLNVTGIITGNGVTPTQMAESDITQNGDKIVSLGFAENRYVKQNAISDTSKIGAMGLFLYTGGDFKAMGSDVHGSLLHSVGMQLPMDGVVSWSQGTAVSTAAAETTWKLLNNTIAGEPCLVLAIRVG